MAVNSFDDYFSTFPASDKAYDFDSFWNESVAKMKNVPLEASIKQNNKKTSSKFKAYNISYNGFMKARITGELLAPYTKEKPRVIIVIHDYNRAPMIHHQLLPENMAYFFPVLRGHHSLPEETDGEILGPGYMIENILEKERYYVRRVYMDILRGIDLLRLIKELDCSSIGIIGKGFGAATAVVAASFSKRVTALALDTPSFCYLPLSQNISESDAAHEINSFLTEMKTKKSIVKKNMTYFDILNFADKIKCPVLATVGFKDQISPPKCVFALFNQLLCEKTMSIFPEEGNNAGGSAQFKKSLEWIIDTVLQAE